MINARQGVPPVYSRRADSSVPRSGLNCLTCQNRNKAEWCGLADEEIRLLNKDKRPRFYPPNHIVFAQGDAWDGLYCIEAGTVAMFHTDAEGRSILVRLGHAGQTMGYQAFFSGGVHNVTARVIQAATMCRISGEFLERTLARSPSLARRYLSRLAGEVVSAEEALLRQSALSVRVRLVHLLLSLMERFGQAGDEAHGHVVMALPVARKDLAAMLGTRPETLARTIAELRADGMVRFDGRCVVVPNERALLDELEPMSA